MHTTADNPDPKPLIEAAMQDGIALKYTRPSEHSYSAQDELLTLKLRYKEPEGSTSKLLSFPMKADVFSENMGESFRWATAVAAFGQYLHQSDKLGRHSLAEIEELAQSAIGEDPFGYRREFIQMIRQARQLEGSSTPDSPYPQWQYRN